MSLLVVLPFHSGDITLARNLLAWIEELGGAAEYPCLLLADAKVSAAQSEPLAAAAKRVFKQVFTHATPMSLADETWPRGANWMFENAAYWIERNQPMPWLWLEPDAVPLREGWLDEIAKGYAAAKKGFVGQTIRPGQAGLPLQMLSGVAVYPPKLPRAILQRILQTKREVAWDVACAGTIMADAAHSSLFYNFYNRQLPPTWVRKRLPEHPKHALEIAKIPKTAVLAHPSKDGSLISVLRGDGEPDIAQLYMVWKEQFEEKKGSIEVWSPGKRALRFVHCTERHAGKDPEALRRSTEALRSWTALYRTGRLVPCHVWEQYARDSRALGDERALPYLKDVLVEGMTKAKADDVIVLTNDDTILHSKVLDALDEKMREVDACGSFRLNFDKRLVPATTTPVEQVLKLGKPDLGRDLFAFKKSWLREHWFNLPDFLLGELEWDLVVAVMIRRSAGIFTDKKNIQEPMPRCEIERGYVMHEFHERQWTSEALKRSPAKVHNKRLAIEWYSKNSFPSLISNF